MAKILSGLWLLSLILGIFIYFFVTDPKFAIIFTTCIIVMFVTCVAVEILRIG